MQKKAMASDDIRYDEFKGVSSAISNMYGHLHNVCMMAMRYGVDNYKYYAIYKDGTTVLDCDGFNQEGAARIF